MWGTITRDRGTAPGDFARRRRRRRGEPMSACDIGRARRYLADRIAAATDWPRDDVDSAAAESGYAELLWWAWRLGALRPDDPPADVRRWHCADCDRTIRRHDERPRAGGGCRQCRAGRWSR